MRRLCLFMLTLACWGCEDDVSPLGVFCHGERDGLPCDDGNPCTQADRCGGGVCLGRPVEDGARCSDDDACTVGDVCRAGVCESDPRDCSALNTACAIGVCSPRDGRCVAEPLQNDLDCDDGNACTEGDHCRSGRCLGSPVLCPAADRCHTTRCDPQDGCQTEPMPDDAPCNDAEACTVGERCVAGACVPRYDQCFCADQPDGTPCDDANSCTLNTRCVRGECVGEPRRCDADETCRVGVCDPQSGECTTIAADNGTVCTDEDACTTEETCQDGACVGAVTCFCADQADGTPCDDRRACTRDDVCLAGACQGAPIDCGALDGVCVEGACAPETGECVARPRPRGTPCDDGSACTEGDACVAGNCEGVPLDCSALDAGCAVGRCAEDDGACALEVAPDGHACDDADPCTAQGTCAAGACTPGPDLCAPCAGRAQGDPCDDGDPCTALSACVREDAGLLCRGAARDCSALDDACAIGQCDARSGECRARPRPDRTPCDDGEACTRDDACRDGQCEGAPILLCGAEPQLCEPGLENGDAQGAVALPLINGAAIAVGRFEPAGDADWYAIEVNARQRISAITRSHCGSVADTLLGVYLPDGETLIGFVDDVDDDPWARIADVPAPRDGTFYIGVGSFAASGQADYQLEVRVTDPPPCANDDACGCADLRCEATVCVPRAPSEIEPGDGEASHGPLAMGATVHGAIDAVGDTDWFTVELAAGTPISLDLRPLCDGPIDAEVALFDSNRDRPLHQDAGTGPAGHPRVDGIVAPAAGTYWIRVRGENASSGAYLLSVVDGQCEDDAACGCEAQVCGGAPARCLPANPTPEGPMIVPLPLGETLHGVIAPAFDSDEYTVELADRPYDIATRAYCGARTDTQVEIFDEAGALLLSGEDAGDDQHAAIRAWRPPAPGTYIVRVTAFGASSGAYLIEVAPTP